MNHQSKLTQKQDHAVEQQSQQQPAREFATSDELLRFDAAQTAVPSEIARRLQASSQKITPPKSRRWWENLFGH